MRTSTILTCNDLIFAKEHLKERLNGKMVKYFEADEFKVENTASVIKEAYIAEEGRKYLVLSAFSYNVYAQNALLKLLEEPPRNIVFILLTRSKNNLLPTIRSRLQIEVLAAPKVQVDLGLELRYLDFEMIFTFLKKHRYTSKEELKEIIEQLLIASVKEQIVFKESELEMFDKALVLVSLNSRAQNILSYLLLMIYHAKKRQ